MTDMNQWSKSTTKVHEKKKFVGCADDCNCGIAEKREGSCDEVRVDDGQIEEKKEEKKELYS